VDFRNFNLRAKRGCRDVEIYQSIVANVTKSLPCGFSSSTGECRQSSVENIYVAFSMYAFWFLESTI